MSKVEIFLCSMIVFNIVCIVIVCIVIVIVDADQLNTKTISLKESEWKCTETEHTKAWDGCVVYKYIGDKSN